MIRLALLVAHFFTECLEHESKGQKNSLQTNKSKTNLDTYSFSNATDKKQIFVRTVKKPFLVCAFKTPTVLQYS